MKVVAVVTVVLSFLLAFVAAWEKEGLFTPPKHFSFT